MHQEICIDLLETIVKSLTGAPDKCLRGKQTQKSLEQQVEKVNRLLFQLFSSQVSQMSGLSALVWHITTALVCRSGKKWRTLDNFFCVFYQENHINRHRSSEFILDFSINLVLFFLSDSGFHRRLKEGQRHSFLGDQRPPTPASPPLPRG